MSTPQTYAITSTATYSTTDGSERYYLTAGTVIPMSLAIDMGLTGAGYDDPVYFTANEQAALVDLIGLSNLLPYVQSAPRNGIATAQGWLTTNIAYFFRVRVAKAITVTTMAFPIGTASGNVDLGIFTSADGGTTLTRVASTGSTAAAGTNTIQEIALTAPYTLEPGVDYWLAMAADNTAVTTPRTAVLANADAGGYQRMQLSSLSAFPLPETVTPIASNVLIWFAAAP